MLRQYELVERVRSYNPQADEALINRAYVFSMKAHGSEVRASGDPYCSHRIEVAAILADLHLDDETIVAAILHDTIEDTLATPGEIETHFGRGIADLVDGVTKLSKIEARSESERAAENLRKFLLAMSDDIRVLLVKLADRLHSMRSLHFIEDETKRRRIARETMDVYAPLAERIGMYEFMTEMQTLAFRELEPDAYEAITRRLARLHDGTGSDLILRISRGLKAHLEAHDVEAEVTGREKPPYSIWRKMAERHVSFDQLSDLVAFRCIVGSVDECYRTLGVIHQRWPMVPGRFKDFISTPKRNGYRSLHTTAIHDEQIRIEIQIRTREMHAQSEYFAVRGTGNKAGTTGEDRPPWINDLVEILEYASSEELREHTRMSVYQDRVFAFTPGNELIQLPKGATPVDFAYAVHSTLGDETVGAKVNGVEVPLETVLSNGDQVEILRSESQVPQADWLRFVATAKARAAIRRHLRKGTLDAPASPRPDPDEGGYIQFTTAAVERILKKAASPAITRRGHQIDATNGAYETRDDIPLEWLPRHLLSCTQILRQGISENAPALLRAPLDVYSDEIKESKGGPIIQTLVFCASMITAAMANPDFDFWANGLTDQFESFLSDHRRLIEHYPELVARREALATLPVDFSADIGRALSDFVNASGKVLDALVDSGIATEKAAKVLQQQLRLAQSITAEIHSSPHEDPIGDRGSWSPLHDQAANSLGVWIQVRDHLEHLFSITSDSQLEPKLPVLVSAISRFIQTFVTLAGR